MGGLYVLRIIMKYLRYTLITVLSCLLITSIYYYAIPNITVESSVSVAEDDLVSDKDIAWYRTIVIRWILLIGTILSGWIFYYRRRFACSMAIFSMLVLSYIVWKDLTRLGGTTHQKMVAIEHGLTYSLNWMTAFYLTAAVLLLVPILKRQNKTAHPTRYPLSS